MVAMVFNFKISTTNVFVCYVLISLSHFNILLPLNVKSSQKVSAILIYLIQKLLDISTHFNYYEKRSVCEFLKEFI